MGIYRDNLSAIIIGDNFSRLSLSLKIVWIYPLPISFLQHILLSLINYRDKRFFRHTMFKGRELALWQNKKSLFVVFNLIAESMNCSLFLKNLEKRFCDLTLRKKLRQTH